MRILEEALTFDDVLLVPAYSEVLPREVDLTTRLTRNISLNLPVVSAAMDTVTEARLAITIAQEGGIGIVHKSLTIEGQAREVARVKKFESGVIKDPITVPPDTTIRQVLDLTRAHGISGVPVVQGRHVLGIVTHRDLRFEEQLDALHRFDVALASAVGKVQGGVDALADAVGGKEAKENLETIIEQLTDLIGEVTDLFDKRNEAIIAPDLLTDSTYVPEVDPKLLSK